MKRAISIIIVALFTSVTLSFAQDAAVVNSEFVKVKLNNDRVRVLEAVLKPGDKEELHSHPAAVIYVISGGEGRSHSTDGQITEMKLKSGEVVYREPLTHWAENTGTTTIHLMIVELKNDGTQP